MEKVTVINWDGENVQLDADDPMARVYCGGSYDVPQVVGTATTGGKYDVFERKLYPGRIEKKVTMPMHWGNICEHPFRIRTQQVLAKLGLSEDEKVIEGKTFYANEFMYTARSTPDGLLEGNSDVVFEYKTRWWADRDLYGEEMTSQCQAQEYDQCQWHMKLTGAKVCFLGVWFHPGEDIVWYKIERDEERIKFISDEMFEFFTLHLQTGTPPPTDETEGCRQYWMRIEAQEKAKREFTDKEYALALELDSIKQEMKNLKSEEKRIGNELRAAMVEHEELYRPGEKTKVTHKFAKNAETRTLRLTVAGAK
jgi:hypothetical protein